MMEQFNKDFKSSLMFPEDDGNQEEGAQVCPAVMKLSYLPSCHSVLPLCRRGVMPCCHAVLLYRSGEIEFLLASQICIATQVLPSSGDMFIFFRNSMVQCSALSNEQPLFDLHNVFKTTLSYVPGKLAGSLEGDMACTYVGRMQPRCSKATYPRLLLWPSCS
jgi:hypothetical protein